MGEQLHYVAVEAQVRWWSLLTLMLLALLCEAPRGQKDLNKYKSARRLAQGESTRPTPLPNRPFD